MKKYIVIMQLSRYNLEQSVDKMLNNNWFSVGGVSVIVDNKSDIRSYHQAMVYKDYDKNISLDYSIELQTRYLTGEIDEIRREQDCGLETHVK